MGDRPALLNLLACPGERCKELGITFTRVPLKIVIIERHQERDTCPSRITSTSSCSACRTVASQAVSSVHTTVFIVFPLCSYDALAASMHCPFSAAQHVDGVFLFVNVKIDAEIVDTEAVLAPKRL